MTINDAEMKQNNFDTKRIALNNYFPKSQKYIEAKISLINNVNNFYEGRKKIIEGFKEKLFPIKFDDDYKTEQQTSKKSTKTDVNAFNEWVIKKETKINNELFKNHFFFQTPSALLKELNKTTDKEKNSTFVSMINSGLKDLEEKLIRCLKMRLKLKSHIK